MTGWRLTSSMPAMMRSLSSCFEATRMWRRTERANLEKKPSMRLSHEPCLGVKVNSKRPLVGGEPGSGFSRYVCGMIVEDQLDRGAGRIGGIEKLEEFDELAAAVAISDERVDLAGEQINPGQQAERAMTFVLMIAREGRVDARLGRQIRRRRCDGLDSRLFVVGDDRHRFRRAFPIWRRLSSGPGPRDRRTEPRAIFCSNSASRRSKIVAHLVRLDFLLAEDLAHRALDQIGETFVPRRRSVLARMTGQKPRRPQLVRIAVLLGLVARQRHQPGFGLRRDGWFLARPRRSSRAASGPSASARSTQRWTV